MPLEETLAEFEALMAAPEKLRPSEELERLFRLEEEDPQAFARVRENAQLKEQFDEARDETTLEKVYTAANLSRGLAKGGLKKTGAGLLRTVGARNAARRLSASGEADIKEAQGGLDELGGGTGPTAMLTSTAIQSLPVLLAAPLGGLPAIAAAAGAQSFGGVEDEAYNAYLRAGKSEKEAYLKSLAPAAASGLITGLLTRFMPGGTERAFMTILKSGVSKEVARKGVLEALKSAAKTIPKEAISEFPEEGLDQLAQGIVAKFSYAPEKTTPEILRESLIAGLAGAALGGTIASLPASLNVARGAVESVERGKKLEDLQAQRASPERAQTLESIRNLRTQQEEAEQERKAAEPLVESIMAQGQQPAPPPPAPPVTQPLTPQPNAQGIPQDQTQPPAPGQVLQGSQADSGSNLQQAPPIQPEPVAPREEVQPPQEAPPWLLTKEAHRATPQATTLPKTHWLHNVTNDLTESNNLQNYDDNQLGVVADMLGSDKALPKTDLIADLRRKWATRLRLKDASLESLTAAAPEDVNAMLYNAGLSTDGSPQTRAAKLISWRDSVRSKSLSIIADMRHADAVSEANARGDAVPEPVRLEYPAIFTQPAPDPISQALKRVSPQLERMGVTPRELSDEEAASAGLTRGAGVAADVFSYDRNQFLVHKPTLAKSMGAVQDPDAYLSALVDHEYVHFGQREVLREAFDATGQDPAQFGAFVRDHYQAIFNEMTPEQVSAVVSAYLGREGTPADMPTGEWGTAFEFVRMIVQGERTGATDETIARGGSRFKEFLQAIIEKLKSMLAIAEEKMQPILAQAVDNVQRYLDAVEANETTPAAPATGPVTEAPAQAAAPTPRALARTVTLEAGRGNVPQVEAELQSAGAQHQSLINIFQTVGARTGADQTTMNRLGMSRASRVVTEASRLYGAVVGGVYVAPDYAAVMASTLHPSLKNMVTLDMSHVLRNYEMKFESVRTNLAKQSAKVASPDFRRRVHRMNVAEMKAKAAERVVKTFTAAMQAGMNKAKIALDTARATSVAIEEAQAEYDLYHELMQFPQAIRQRAEDMAAVLWATPSGQALLMDPNATRADFLKAYVDAKDAAVSADPTVADQPGWIPHRGKNERALTSVVADLFARSQEVVLDMMAATMPQALLQPLSKLEQQLFDGLKDDPGKTIARIIRKAENLSTEQGRLMALWRALNKEVTSQLERLDSLQKQADLAAQVESSVEWRVLRNTVNTAANAVVVPARLKTQIEDADQRPTLDEKSYQEWVPLPDGTALTIDLRTSELPAEMPKMLAGLAQIRNWLQDPANMDQKDASGNVIPNSRDPYYPFWEMTYRRIDQIYTSSLGIGNFVQSLDRNLRTGGITSTRHGSWGMLEFMLKAAQIPAGRIASVATHNWKAAYEQSGAWIRTASPVIARALIEASRAHGFHKGNVAGDDISSWYREVGNELFFSAQEVGRTKRIGDLLGSGRRVKREDLAALRAMHEQVEKLIRTNMRIGRENVMEESRIQDQEGVWRKALELGDQMLPRIFDTERGQWVGTFHKIGMAGRHDGKPVRRWLEVQAKAEMLAHLNADQFSDFMYAFAADRSPDFSRPSPWEHVYAELAEDMRLDRESQLADPGAAPLAPRSMQEVFAYIQARTPTTITYDAIVTGVMDEVVRQVENVYKQVFEGSKTKGESEHQRNAFTAAREARLANFFFYKHGFSNSPSVVGFGMDAASYWYERMLWSLKGRGAAPGVLTGGLVNALNQELARREAEIKRLKQTENLTETAARDRVDKANRAYQDYEHLAHQIQRWVQHAELEYSSGGRVEREEFETMQRVWGAQVGLALATVNSGANVYGSTRFLGEAVRAQTGSALLGHLTAWKSMAWELIVTGVPAAFKLGAYGVRNVALAPAAFAKAQGGLKPRVAAALQRLFEGLSDDIWTHSQFYQDMVRLGYHSPDPLAFNLGNRILLGSTGGKVYAMKGLSRGTWTKPLSDFFWGAVINGVEIPTDILRSFLPRGFDMLANIMSMRNAASVVNMLEAQLRRTFNEAPPGHFNLANPKAQPDLLPSELVPSPYFKLFPKTTNHTKEIIEWFTNAGIPLTETVMDFFSRLQGKSKEEQLKEKFLTPDQVLQLGAIVMEDTNRATALNRPIQTRTSPFLRIISTFHGYWFHRLRKFLSIHGPALEDPVVNSTLLRVMSSIGFIGPVLVLGALYGYQDEYVRRWLYRFFYGEERAFRLPHEGMTRTEQAQSAAALYVGAVPLIGSFLSQYVGAQPGRSVGVTAFAQNRINDIASYVVGVAKSGDPSYRLPSLLAGTLPLGKIVLNRLPAYEGVTDAKNATRLLQREGEADLIRTPGGFSGSSHVTPLTPYGQRILNSIMRGDIPQAQALRAEAVAVATKMGLAHPERSVQQMIEAQNPVTRAFRVKPTQGQIDAVFNRLSPTEADYLRTQLDTFQAGARALGASANLSKEEALSSRASYSGGGQASLPRTSAVPISLRRRGTSLRLRRGRSNVRTPRARRIRLRSRSPRLRRSGRRSSLRLRKPRTVTL